MLVSTNIMKVRTRERLPATERRRSILNAALTILSKEGYAGMTTSRVAGRIGVSEPILYRHFPSKRAIMRAVLDEVIARMMASFRELVAGETDPVAALLRICRAYPELASQYRQEFRIINQTLAGNNDPAVRAALTRHYDTYRAFLEALILKGQQTGALRRDVTATAGAWHMIHSALGFLMVQDIRMNAASSKDFEAFAIATVGGLLNTR